MDAIALTKLFVQYKETKNLLESLEKQIQEAVLESGQSQNMAGVKATLYSASTEYDYEAACRAFGEIPDMLIADHTTNKPTIRWKEIAEIIGANLEPWAIAKPARVVVK